MSKDIRSFFKTLPQKTTSSKTQETKKKVIRIIDSDDEDVVECTPEKSKINKESQNIKKDKGMNLKPVNIDDIFSNEPIKQSKVVPRPKSDTKHDEEKKKSSKSKKKKLGTETGIHDNDAFEKTLVDLDDDMFIDNLDVLDKTINEALDKEKETKQGSSKENSPNKPKELEKIKDDKIGKRQRTPSEGSTPKKIKLEHTDSGIDPDQEAYEKKRYSALLYQKYKNRAGPKLHGQKELPKGNPDCLKKLTFLRTGVLESLEGEEFENIVVEHGGRVVKAVSKKVDYIVVGEDAGPAKLEKARGFGIPAINENQFLDLILTKSGMKPKYSQESQESIDSGIMDDPPREKKRKIEQSPKKESRSKSIEADREKEVKQSQRKKEKEKSSPHEKRKGNSIKDEDKIRDKPNLGKLKVESSEKKQKLVESEINKNDRPIPKSQETPRKQDTNKDTALSESKKDKRDIKEMTLTKDSDKKEKPDINKDIALNESKKHKRDIKEVTLAKDSDKKQKRDISKDISTTNPSTPSVENDQSSSKNLTSTSSLSWTDKYKPSSLQSIIGQQGDSSNVAKLRKWLSSWYRNQLPKNRKNLLRPSPWAKNDDGAFYKAALLSGPPGVGKTTTATLVSKELGFDVVEFNASDTRSKKLLQEEVSQLLKTTTIAGFAAGKTTTDKKRVLLMDEVDGMAGNEDRGGIQELMILIKNSNIPIICMCNDRNHQKMRTFVNYCFDLRFNKPKMEQIRGPMMSICFKEGLNISANILSEIITGTGCDIRQTLNHLTMYAALKDNISLEDVQNKAKASKKDTVLGPWEVIRYVFTESEQRNMSLSDKMKLFFYDYSLGPLFVQENYLGVNPKCPKEEKLKHAALAADSISRGDLIDSKIRGSNNWSLLESQALFASVLPGYYMSGNITHRINFPSWLGKNSTANKFKRLLTELHSHSRMSTSGNSLAMKLDYMVPLRDAIISPLIKDGSNGVQQSVQIMQSYNLLRDDLNNLIELCDWKDSKNPFNSVEPKVKAALTRTYNKVMLPFAPGSEFSKKKVSHVVDNLDENEDGIESDDETKDDLSVDSLVKVKNTKKKAEPSTSKKDTTKKGGKGKNKKS